MNELMNNEGVCRTAPTSPGLLISNIDMTVSVTKRNRKDMKISVPKGSNSDIADSARKQQSSDSLCT